MTAKDFDKFVKGNAKMPVEQVVYSFVGLAGETGEVMEWLKKSYFRKDAKYTTDDLQLELGDVIHYASRIAQAYGWSLEDVMAVNVKKLKAKSKNGKGGWS